MPANTNNPPGLTVALARSLARGAGFDDAGVLAFPHRAESRDAERFRAWVRDGRSGSMQYLQRSGEDGRLTRESARIPFPWARTALVCFAGYLSPGEPLSTTTPQRENGWIARYAWSSKMNEKGERRPSDYHKVLLKRLREVEAKLRADFGDFESRAYVDTGPVVERSLAVAAGLGWTGKNTCLIHPKLGSFGFLAVLLTSLEASPAAIFSPEGERGPGLEVPDRCGTCRRCIDACPTHALDAPYQMDATRCIAYLTIEHKGPIAEELMAGIGRQVFGCDICQDVCPWNQKSLGHALRSGPTAADPELEPRHELVNPALQWLGALDEPSFERLFNGSPVRRAGFRGLQRNVAIAMGNSGLGRFLPRLEEWACSADEGLRSAAQWALGRLRKQPPR